MTWKQINTSREIRQWITGVILPIAGGILIADAANPNIKYQIKDKIKNIFKKEDEPT